DEGVDEAVVVVDDENARHPASPPSSSPVPSLPAGPLSTLPPPVPPVSMRGSAGAKNCWSTQGKMNMMQAMSSTVAAKTRTSVLIHQGPGSRRHSAEYTASYPTTRTTAAISSGA